MKKSRIGVLAAILLVTTGAPSAYGAAGGGADSCLAALAAASVAFQLQNQCYSTYDCYLIEDYWDQDTQTWHVEMDCNDGPWDSCFAETVAVGVAVGLVDANCDFTDVPT